MHYVYIVVHSRYSYLICHVAFIASIAATIKTACFYNNNVLCVLSHKRKTLQ